MTLGSWDPTSGQQESSTTLTLERVRPYIALGASDTLDNLDPLLSAEEKQANAALMQLPPESWYALAEQLADSEIEQLMRFFTCAEQLPGWQAGANSPVIWLGKVLKKRGTGISKPLTLWIRSHSDNRFLPHGPLL